MNSIKVIISLNSLAEKNILKIRENHKLSLRKEDINEIIFKKREKALEKNEEISHLEINPENLKLSSDYFKMNINVYDLYLNIRR